MTVVFRVDASSTIGLGHLRRCLSLATALNAIGGSCHFLCAETDFDCRALVEAANFSYHPLGLFVGDWQADFENVKLALDRKKPEWVVVDHYGLDNQWHDAIKCQYGCKVGVIDDLANRDLHCDLLLDQNYSSDPAQKYAGRVLGKYLGLFGPAFAMLDPAFVTAERYEFSDEVRSIGIFMGGTDALNISSRVIDAIESTGFSGRVEVATTSGNPALEQLRERVSRANDTRITIDLPNLAGFFSRHDMQVGAGGSATWERCCIGVPSILIPFVKNHNVVLDSLGQLQIASAIPWGWDNTLLVERISHLIKDSQQRRMQHEKGMSLVDGHGAVRVAIAMLRDQLQLRPATVDDSLRAYEWRNSPNIRAASHNSGAITLEGHQQWFMKMLQSENRRMFVAMVGSREVGHIRLDRESEKDEVSFYIDPKLNGLGIGSRMLSAVESRSRAEAIFGTVVKGNVVSHRLFEKNEYRRIGTDRWEKQLNQNRRNGL